MGFLRRKYRKNVRISVPFSLCIYFFSRFLWHATSIVTKRIALVKKIFEPDVAE